MLNFIGKSKRGPWIAAALTAVLLGATPSRSRSAAPKPPPPPEKQLTFRDILLTVHARTALADDPILGPANLGVRVQDHVAVLWGPAPSEEARRRAVDLVKKVKGVFEVRDAEVYVAAPPPPVVPLPVRTPPAPAEGPTRTESDSPDPVTGTLSALAAPAAVAPTAPARTVSAAPPEDLASALLRTRLAEARFVTVEYRLEGDAVVLRGGSGRPEDVMAFARAISHLPGLVRIEVRDDAAGP